MKYTDFTAEQMDCLEYTVLHFQEVARQNRFAENSSIEHDAERCVICHPDLVPQDRFLTYLHVITPSVLVRRPCLDQELVDEINGDLAMGGEEYRVSRPLWQVVKKGRSSAGRTGFGRLWRRVWGFFPSTVPRAWTSTWTRRKNREWGRR